MFHSLLAPESGVYIEQVSCKITGELDIKAFSSAWQTLIDDHAVLRTAFLSKGLKEPLQVVYRKVDVPFEILDWQHFADNEKEAELEKFSLGEQEKGFILSKAPLMRITLARSGSGSYYFIWTYHHILLDGWSMPLLFREVMLRYDSISNNRQYQIKPAGTYRDYIVWLKKQKIGDAEKFWQEQLKGLGTPTLLSRKSNKNEQEESYSELKVSLPKDVMKDLQLFAHKYQLTMNTIVQGAWAILLGAYTQQSDVVYGTTVSGRPVDLPGAESIIGLLINTLPVRVDITPEKTLPEWLRQMQNLLLEMRQYEYMPLAEMQKFTGIPNSRSLFDSLLIFENYPTEALKGVETKGMEIKEVKFAEKTNFPVALVIGQSDTLEFRLIYGNNCIGEVIAGNMLENLKTIITSFIKPEINRLPDVEVISEIEKRNILTRSKGDTGFLSEKYCLQELFEIQAEKTPSKTAVIFKDQELTYYQLERKANQLANYLIRQGIERESLVGVLFDKSLEMIIAVLGILKSGGAYVPIEPSIPLNRLNFMMEDAGVKTLITQSIFREKLHESSLNIIYLDGLLEELEHECDEKPRERSTPENLAYIIYTSGSTGKPKGTLVLHSGAVNFVKGFSKIIKLNPSEKWMQFFTLSFDGSVADIFSVLCSGGTLLIPERMALLDFKNLAGFITQNSVTTIFMTPSIFSMINESEIPSVEKILVGGEVCSQELAFRLSQGRQLFNLYGPTETSVAVTGYEMDEFADSYNSVPIGKPMLNTELLVLDRNYRIIPTGCIGELFIGGQGVARGYLNRPELTAEKFIPNPYADSPGERLYRSGDLVRLLPDGNFEFIKRIDEQVKIRGYRIELREIESVIRQSQGVRDVFVKVINEEVSEKKVSAYIIPEEGEMFDLEKVKEEVAGNIPGYMVPSRYLCVKEFPLNSNGKIDRNALPEAETLFENTAKTYHPPRDAWELNLVQIWEEILKIHPVGIKDNFFDLGGHSLLAIRFMDLLQERFNRSIPLVTIYQNPTIESLAPFLKDEGENKKPSLLVELKKGGEAEPLFFIHPSGGSVHWYSDLAKYIDPATPFYGLQAVGIDGKDKLDDSIEVMASRYIDNILKKQPDGPYYIGGWSFGVIVAFEAARQLIGLGHEVKMLALLDCGPFLPYDEPEDSAELLADIFSKYTHIDVDNLRTMNEDERYKFVFKLAKKNKLIPFYVRISEFSFYIHILKTMQQAWRKYELKTYPGEITVFRSDESKSNLSLTPDLGWSGYTSMPVNVIDVPGNHISMMLMPNVMYLAEQLNHVLSKSRESQKVSRGINSHIIK